MNRPDPHTLPRAIPRQVVKRRGTPMHPVTEGRFDADLLRWKAAGVKQCDMAKGLNCSDAVVSQRLTFLRGRRTAPDAAP